jgi:AmmeMemoRadiSam system protein A
MSRGVMAIISRVFVIAFVSSLLFTDCSFSEGGSKKALSADSSKEIGMEDKGRLSEDQGRRLISIARKTIEKELFPNTGGSAVDDAGSESGVFEKRRGTFVTITKGGSLRGCIGHIIPQESILEGVKENAINAAFRDPRFSPLNRNEFKDIRIEISILTEPEELHYSGEKDLLARLRPGVDGVIIKKGYRQATFLPQVWEQLPAKEEFLAHLCLKAGLSPDAWRKGDLQVSTYQVQAFEE